MKYTPALFLCLAVLASGCATRGRWLTSSYVNDAATMKATNPEQWRHMSTERLAEQQGGTEYWFMRAGEYLIDGASVTAAGYGLYKGAEKLSNDGDGEGDRQTTASGGDSVVINGERNTVIIDKRSTGAPVEEGAE